jgi:transcriptional regulator with XRE-family HTH domain
MGAVPVVYGLSDGPDVVCLVQVSYDSGMRSATSTASAGAASMKFGDKVRALRKAKGWSLRVLAEKVGVGFTYLSRVENERLNFGDYPSDALIHRLADALEADEEELLMLAERVPDRIRKRVLQRPDVFGALANCDDKTLDKVMGTIGGKAKKKRAIG